jgi:hypothetical protein
MSQFESRSLARPPWDACATRPEFVLAARWRIPGLRPVRHESDLRSRNEGTLEGSKLLIIHLGIPGAIIVLRGQP